MNNRPVGSLQETLIASAEFNPNSAFLFMNMTEHKKELQKRLQKARENAFFDSNRRATNVTLEDIQTDDIILPKKDQQRVQSIVNGEWKTIIEDCYSYRDTEEPLSRLNSVARNTNLPSVDTASIVFDPKNVRVDTIDGEEAVEVHVGEDESLVMFIQTDNIEFYQGMYDPPITREVETLYNHIGGFDTMTVRNNSEIGKKLMNSAKPETIQRDITSTEIIFGNELDKGHYLPESRITKISENDELLSDIQDLRSIDPLPDKTSKKKLLETLERGYIMSEKSLKLFEYIIGNVDTTMVSYSYTAIPEYIEEVARITNANIINLPQMESIILTRKEVPEWMNQLDEKFPDKNELSKSKIKRLDDFLELPSFTDLTTEWMDTIECNEIILEEFEKQNISQDHIVSYYVYPWEYVIPRDECVNKAIEYGDKLRRDLRSVDRKHGTELYDSTVIWEQRKIYRKSNFEI